MRYERDNGSAVVIAMASGLALVCLTGGFAWMQWKRSLLAQQVAVQAQVDAEQALLQAEQARSEASARRDRSRLIGFASQPPQHEPQESVDYSQADVAAGSGELDEEQEIAAIKSLLFTQQAAWNEADIEGFMEGYWKSDKLTFSSGGKTRRSWQQTLEHYRKSYPTPEKMGQLEFSELEVELLAPDVALVLGRWNLKDLAHGNFTIILRKLSTGWVIIHDHSSESPPVE